MPCPSDSTLCRHDLVAFNINPKSFLATDYLNHFNEVIMLINMLPDMPDMLDDVLEWEPKSYPNHFAQSGFAGREMAIAAYHQSPIHVRGAFDAVVSEIDTLLLSTMSDLKRTRDNPEMMINLARQALEPVPKGLSDWGTRDSKGLFRPSWSERCGPQPLAGSIVARDFDMKRI